jgi:hypothetical protein
MTQQMDRFGEATLIQQDFDLIQQDFEIFGEAKQRYRVHPVGKRWTVPGTFQSMYIREVTNWIEKLNINLASQFVLDVSSIRNRDAWSVFVAARTVPSH